ncbi:ribosome biogenesis protein C1orf109 homolog isoform X2 [Harpia harpyja]|uniref:ribosome biogenesis protein C1orf109 homolog isoform X2 n=1 Tax=Harpia harpyja TaxID=202280 RepID=UPI0022B193B1|nr:ribosome biogenesis protein C1orf109 homolog isoform X2 [Harpia harpyja]
MAAAAAMAAALREWAAAAARQDAAWRAAMAAWAPLLVSLAGLAAQMRAAQRLAWGGSPLGPFGDLRARLWRKQRGAAEALLEQLGGRRAELRAVRDAVGAGVAAVLRLYEERAAELGLAAALRRGPRCPSLADALEGLQDVERYYRQLKVPGEQAAAAPHPLRQPGRHGGPPAVLGEDFGALQGRRHSRYAS